MLTGITLLGQNKFYKSYKIDQSYSTIHNRAFYYHYTGGQYITKCPFIFSALFDHSYNLYAGILQDGKTYKSPASEIFWCNDRRGAFYNEFPVCSRVY